MKKERTKKILFLLIIGISVLTLACADESVNNRKEKNRESNQITDDNKENISDEATLTEVTETANSNINNSKEAFASQNLQETDNTNKKILVIAHRGYSYGAPENTILAYEKAEELGADMIELDVQMTKDKKIVVFHDNNMQRITGINGMISDYSFEEIEELSGAANYKGQYLYGVSVNSADYYDLKIPSFEEVVKFCSENNIGIDIEIKNISEEAGFTDYEINAYIDEVVKEVENNNMAGNVIFSSFNYDYLKRIDAKYPDYKTVYITEQSDIDFLVANCQTDGIAIWTYCLTDDAVERFHEAGLECYIWTTDSYIDMEYAYLHNADGIITNRVDRAVLFFSKRH